MITTTSTDNCNHTNFIYKRISIDFKLFYLEMKYKLCLDCTKLIKTHKYWKIV